MKGKNGLFNSILGISIVLSIIVFYRVKTNVNLFETQIETNRSPTSVITPLPETTRKPTLYSGGYEDATSLTESPQPYPGFSWHKITGEITLPSPYLMFNGKPIVLTGGQAWMAQTNTDKDWLVFTEYYDTKYNQLGWRDKVMVNGMILEFQGAEGPTGWVQGFVGIKDDKFRVFYYHTAKINVATQKEDIQCPCYEKYTIYLSDIIPFDRLSSLVESKI